MAQWNKVGKGSRQNCVVTSEDSMALESGTSRLPGLVLLDRACTSVWGPLLGAGPLSAWTGMAVGRAGLHVGLGWCVVCVVT
jgi:hypothetical protein